MNRRGFLGKVLALAGAAAVAPAVTVEAATVDTAVPVSEQEQARRIVEAYWRTPEGLAEIQARARSLTSEVSPLPEFYFISDPLPPPDLYLDHPIHLEPGSVQVVYGTVAPLTFEAMATDCAARGCSLEQSILSDTEGRWANYYHRPLPDSWQDNPDDPSHLARVNEWRQSLHGEG